MIHPRVKILQPHSPDCANHDNNSVPPLFLNTEVPNCEYRDAIGRGGNGRGEPWIQLRCLDTDCHFRVIVAVRDLENIVANLAAKEEAA